jgi:hypothetical protein
MELSDADVKISSRKNNKQHEIVLQTNTRLKNRYE